MNMNSKGNGIVISTHEKEALAESVHVTDFHLMIELNDGRTISAPLAWYPRLLNGTKKERNHYRLIGDGEGIHWPDLDEDISVIGLIEGRRSMECQRSLKEWLEKRDAKPVIRKIIRARQQKKSFRPGSRQKRKTLVSVSAIP